MTTRMMPGWQCLVGMALAVFVTGCGGRPRTISASGDVTWQGQPVREGTIAFLPAEGTRGPSTGGLIAAGRYDIAPRVGLLPGGIYRVEITATGKERTYDPAASPRPGNPIVRVTEELLPPEFNRETTLRATVADGARQHHQDFHLEKPTGSR